MCVSFVGLQEEVTEAPTTVPGDNPGAGTESDWNQFNIRYREMRGQALAWAHRWLEGRADVEDACAIAWAKAWARRDQFQGGSSFTTWFYRILRNTCLDECRRTYRQREIGWHDLAGGDEADAAETPDFPDPASDQLDYVLLRELKLRIFQAIRKLSPVYRNTLILSEIRGWDNERIARRMGCPVTTVARRKHEAKLLLRQSVRLD